MEVTGKRQNADDCKASSTVSSHGPRVLCQPCAADDESLEADGFCENCQEYLCQTCIKYHRKVTVSKHHTILDKANMPTNVAPQTIQHLCTKTCENHKLEIIKYFCKDHDTVGCGNCMVIGHKTCKTDFIPEIAEEFVKGDEFKEVLAKLEKLHDTVGSKFKATEEGEHVCYQECEAAIEEIKKFRVDIEYHLNKMEQAMISECQRLREKNEKVIKEEAKFLKCIKSELDEITCRLKSNSKKAADTFVHAKQTNVRLDRLENDLKQEVDCIITHCQFQRNSDLDLIISKTCPLGQLSSHSSELHSPEAVSIADFTPVFSCDINVKSQSDKSDGIISNMLSLSLHKLLCVDRGNNILKVVDTEQKCVSSQIILESYPWDMTFISADHIAITLPSIGKINFLTFKDYKLTFVKAVKVDGECRGIAYNRDSTSLVVSFVGPSKLQTLTLNGEVIHNFKANLGWCGCLVTSVCGSHFFASDLSNNCVRKISFDGKLLETYQDKGLKGPRSMHVCEDGSVLICSSYNNELHLMSQDCRKLRIFPIENRRLNKLQSVFYNETTSTLYLSNYTGNSVLVYKQA